jgi:hypothetical protein
MEAITPPSHRQALPLGSAGADGRRPHQQRPALCWEELAGLR